MLFLEHVSEHNIKNDLNKRFFRSSTPIRNEQWTMFVCSMNVQWTFIEHSKIVHLFSECSANIRWTCSISVRLLICSLTIHRTFTEGSVNVHLFNERSFVRFQFARFLFRKFYEHSFSGCEQCSLVHFFVRILFICVFTKSKRTFVLM